MKESNCVFTDKESGIRYKLLVIQFRQSGKWYILCDDAGNEHEMDANYLHEHYISAGVTPPLNMKCS